MDKVKCAGCGLLGMRLLDSRRLVETEDITRNTGQLPGIPITGTSGMFGMQEQHIFDPYPVCLARVANFHKEMGNRIDIDIRKNVINVERECSEIVEYHVGLSPIEHVEMLVLKEQREWQERRESADRRWRAWELFVMAVLVTLATILAQLAAAFIERGSMFPVPQSPAASQVQPPRSAKPLGLLDQTSSRNGDHPG